MCCLVCRLITVSECPGMVPVRGSKVRNLLLLSSRGTHTYLILPLIISFNLANDSECFNSHSHNLLVCVFVLLRPSSALLSWLIQLVWMYLAPGPRGRGVEGRGSRYSRGGMWEDEAPRCDERALGRLLLGAWYLFITAMMACKLVCDQRRDGDNVELLFV